VFSILKKLVHESLYYRVPTSMLAPSPQAQPNKRSLADPRQRPRENGTQTQTKKSTESTTSRKRPTSPRKPTAHPSHDLNKQTTRTTHTKKRRRTSPWQAHLCLAFGASPPHKQPSEQTIKTTHSKTIMKDPPPSKPFHTQRTH
jgi:hypothetical protein